MPHPDDDTLPEVFALSGDDHDEILRDLIEITGGHCSITPERISACEGTDERKGQMLTGMTGVYESSPLAAQVRDVQMITQHAFMGDITYQNAGAVFFGKQPSPGYL